MMTKCFSRSVAAAVLLVVFGPSAGSRAQESEIKLDEVPKPVMDSANAKFPGAKMREASKETEQGKTVYELSMTHENRKMDVTFEADGTLVLVETEVEEKDLPAAVLGAVKDKYPGSKIQLVESVKKGPEVKNEVDYYEFHLTTADKKSAEVEVDTTGKILKTEEKKTKEKDDEKKKD
jgi:uncharacterized membrane protein YkoI